MVASPASAAAGVRLSAIVGSFASCRNPADGGDSELEGTAGHSIEGNRNLSAETEGRGVCG